MGWGWGYHGGFWCFGVILLIVIGLFFIVGRRRGCRGGWGDDADAILRRRLANGDIDEAEYQKIKGLLGP